MFAAIVEDERECSQTEPKSKHGLGFPSVVSAAVRSTAISPNDPATIGAGKFSMIAVRGPPPSGSPSAIGPLLFMLPCAFGVARVDSGVQSVFESTFVSGSLTAFSSVYQP